MSTAAVFLAPASGNSITTAPRAATARRMAYLAYGVTAYVMFLAVYLFTYGFVTNTAVPRSIDAPVVQASSVFGTIAAAALNLLLIAGFGLQHSVMARPTFKRAWTRIVPEPLERSTYVFLSNFMMIALFLLWQPMPAVLWNITHPAARAALIALNAAGWLLVVLATFLLNHFDLFGLRHVWLYFSNKPYTRLPFRVPFLYRFVRHPLYVGWLTAFWITPKMSTGHLLFALSMTAYILVAIFFEERNLVETHGENYTNYRKKVPMLTPAIRA